MLKLGKVLPLVSTRRLTKVKWIFESDKINTNALVVTGRNAKSKLMEHRRGAHLSQPSDRVECAECDAAKGGKIGVGKQCELKEVDTGIR